MRRVATTRWNVNSMYLEFGIDDDHYVPVWLREELWKHLGTNHSEQYRKAWFASFPPELWPAEEVETSDGNIFLELRDGTKDSRVAT
jgi:hypothetical protein